MNPEVKKKWLEALRSGKYKQGRWALRNGDNEYCCLGVLCEVARREGVIPNPRSIGKGEDKTYIYGKGFDREGSILPRGVTGWAGLSNGNPSVSGHNLSVWNDSERKSFAEIADLIEAYL